MATYYARNTGGNWNVNATWSTVSSSSSTNTGTFPGAADTAILDSGSGNITINVSSTVLILNCTGHVGTLTFNNNLLMNGNITFGSGMTINTDLGTRQLRLLAGSTITSNGKYLPITIVNTSGTITLADDVDCLNTAANFFGTYVSNSSTLRYFNIRGNFTYNSTVNSLLATPVTFRMTGTGTFTSGGNTLNAPFEISSSGTVTFAATSHNLGNNGINYPSGFKYISGTTITSGATLGLSSNGTVSYKVDASKTKLETVTASGLIELQSTLSADTIQTSTNSTGIVHTFSGTSGFVCDNFALNAVGVNTYRSVSLTPGIDYRVNKLITTPSIPIGASTLASTSGTLLATLTLNGGSRLIRNTMTRIDASGGVFINNIGTITNCKNVGTSTMNILI